MDDLSERLQKLGEAVSETGERLTDAGELDAARRMWLALAPPAPRRRARPLVLAAAAGAIALAVAFAVTRPRGAVSFEVGAPPVRAAVGEWVAADGAAPLPLRFSEGTSVTLAPGARARVTETTARGATVLLERGDVTAAVVHRGPDTRWDLRAGPFAVHVTGTTFDASWDPSGETFAITMVEGTVVVHGPLLPGGRALHGGERLRVSVRDGFDGAARRGIRVAVAGDDLRRAHGPVGARGGPVGADGVRRGDGSASHRGSIRGAPARSRAELARFSPPPGSIAKRSPPPSRPASRRRWSGLRRRTSRRSRTRPATRRARRWRGRRSSPSAAASGCGDRAPSCSARSRRISRARRARRSAGSRPT
ncbi:MAG: FecR domain-containing protein [Minicystis sp.]